VWISSINKIICQSDFSTSLITAFNLSSNSHLYFAQAKSAHISRVINLLFTRFSGTSLLAILRAIHSIKAVLPTQGSPTKTGLFFVLLDKICKVLLISSSLQITGSIFHFLAKSTKSIQYFFKACILFSGSLSVTFSPPLILSITSFTFGLVITKVLKKSFVLVSAKSIKAKSKCSSVTNWSLFLSAIFSASIKTLFKSGDKVN
jgi:hypothetical protein